MELADESKSLLKAGLLGVGGAAAASVAGLAALLKPGDDADTPRGQGTVLSTTKDVRGFCV